MPAAADERRSRFIAVKGSVYATADGSGGAPCAVVNEMVPNHRRPSNSIECKNKFLTMLT